jgi:hypothetical protein
LLTALAKGTHTYYGVMEDTNRQKKWREILTKRWKNLEEEVKKSARKRNESNTFTARVDIPCW